MSEESFPQIDDAYLDELIKNRELQKEADHRGRRIKVFIALLILLLLFLLFLLFLFYLLYSPKQLPTAAGSPFQSVFSIYNLQKPLGVSTDQDNNIYVSNTGARQVLVFNKNGDLTRSLGSTTGRGFVISVYGSAYDEEEKLLYVTDFRMKAIHVFDPKSGEFKSRFPDIPYGVQYGSAGFTPYDVEVYKGKLYVLSFNGLYIFDKKGKLEKYFTKYNDGTKNIDFNFPDALAIDKKGNIYIADTVNRRVVAMRQDGTVRWLAGRPDDGVRIQSVFGLPKGIDVDSQGRVYVADAFHHEIIALDSNGKLISFLGERGVKDGEFNFPEQLEIGPTDILYVVDRENNRVQALTVERFPKPREDRIREYEINYRSFEN